MMEGCILVVGRVPIGDQVENGSGSWDQAGSAVGVWCMEKCSACATICSANGDGDVNFGRSRETAQGSVWVKCE